MGKQPISKVDKCLLLKDLFPRIPHGVICQFELDETHFKPINFLHAEYREDDIYCQDEPEYYSCSMDYLYVYWMLKGYIKPFLRPMSSMTEEEKEEYTSYCFEQPFLQKDKTPNLGSVPMCIDWLNEHHFDYRGLIEKGLAIEAPDGMYKTE